MYDLYKLGWSSFQQLCLSIAREILGQTVESFLDSKDGGRDGAFTGQWRQTNQEDMSGRFVIQCKFTSKSNYTLMRNDLSDEVGKARRLVERGLCDAYVLMTNAGLSGVRDEEIKAAFLSAGAKNVRIFGSTWIDQQIRENKKLRMLVPQVYGLGDLSQILDERAYAQARAILESMREDLAKVVVTDAYRRAAEALDKHGFVLLIGEPAAGKTTIASMLAMAAIDQWNASMLKLESPSKVVEHWNPDEPSQFFWLDDAFGVTQYENFLVRGWNHVIPQIKAMLRKGAKIVMTSRDYIYKSARKDLKESAFPLLEESQVVIDVRELSMDERRQILYNHIKLGRQPVSFRAEIKPFLESVATHQRFIPETARRLADPLFTKDLFIDPYFLGLFVDQREIFLQEVLRGLDGNSKAALAMIYMRGGKLESPITLRESEIDALDRLGSDLGGCSAALEALTGSLVLISNASGDSLWQFKHPTIGDAYAAILIQSPELLGIFLEGSAPEKLVEQVTCGDVAMENAVVIPRSLFGRMLSKLGEMSASREYKHPLLSFWGAKSAVQAFLARRCSKDFLLIYLQQNPGIVDKVSEPGLYLHAVSEVDLAVRLHELDLLPEANRKRFVETISGYALKGEDVDGLTHKGIRKVFKDDEFEELMEKVRLELLPRLDEVRMDLELSHSSSKSPEEHMEMLLGSLDTLKTCFADDEEAVRSIEDEIRQVNDWIEDQTPEDSETPSRDLGHVETQDQPRGERSIFDDIDA